MNILRVCPNGAQFRLLGAGLLLPAFARAQVLPTPATPAARATIVSVSPAELLYKAQLGYEHQLGTHSSLGATAFYNYRRYRGWQVTGYYRQFLTHSFPTGLYAQAQASIFNHTQEASLLSRATYERLSFDYRALSGGAGAGLGYRMYILRRASRDHLLGNVLVGVRAQFRPEPDYDGAAYYPESSFLGQVDEANWHFGPGPGSIFHGLLSVDYWF